MCGFRWLPNMRVQRTRSSPSAHRSPLTRYSLGGVKRAVGDDRLGSYVDKHAIDMACEQGWRAGLWVAALTVTILCCDHSDNVVGPSPTPTPTPRPISGAWVGAFMGEAPLVECIMPASGTASADLVETGSAVTGTLSWEDSV